MEHRAELLQAFHIGPEDLEANRSGALGERQKQLLARSGMMNLLGAFVIGLLLAAILYGVAKKPLVPVQWILALILFGAALAVGSFDFRRTRAAAAEGRVECLTAPVRTQSRGKAGWYLVVGGRSFKLPVRPWQVKNDARYHVYIAPRANRVVGMEPDGWS